MHFDVTGKSSNLLHAGLFVASGEKNPRPLKVAD
jgi:hypothetical protein